MYGISILKTKQYASTPTASTTNAFCDSGRSIIHCWMRWPTPSPSAGTVAISLLLDTGGSAVSLLGDGDGAEIDAAASAIPNCGISPLFPSPSPSPSPTLAFAVVLALVSRIALLGGSSSAVRVESLSSVPSPSSTWLLVAESVTTRPGLGMVSDKSFCSFPLSSWPTCSSSAPLLTSLVLMEMVMVLDSSAWIIWGWDDDDNVAASSICISQSPSRFDLCFSFVWSGCEGWSALI